MALKVTPIERPAALSPPRELRAWGVVASNLNGLRGSQPRSPGHRTACASSACETAVRRSRRRPAIGRDDVIVEVEGKRIAIRRRPRGDRQRQHRQEAVGDVRSRPRASHHGRGAVGYARARRPARRGPEGLGAGDRPGPDATACRTPRPDRTHGRSRDAGLRRCAAAAGRRHRSCRRWPGRSRDRAHRRRGVCHGDSPGRYRSDGLVDGSAGTEKR